MKQENLPKIAEGIVTTTHSGAWTTQQAINYVLLKLQAVYFQGKLDGAEQVNKIFTKLKQGGE